MSSEKNSDSAQLAAVQPLLRLKLLDVIRKDSIEALDAFMRDSNAVDLKKLVLHYAVEVGSINLVKGIVERWANTGHLDINGKDDSGNTPLHLAAAQARADVVEYLMDQSSINDCILNKAHLDPIEVCKNLNIAETMQMKRAAYTENEFAQVIVAARNGDLKQLKTLFNKPRNENLLDINMVVDINTGDTLLHDAVKRGDLEVSKWLLQHGADVQKLNKKGKTPSSIIKTANLDATRRKELLRLFVEATKEQNVVAVTQSLDRAPTLKGYLKKFTNFAQGYKVKWFVLTEDGKLSYYKDQADSSNACRGSLNLATCQLHLNSSEKLKFELIGGTNGTIKWHLKGIHAVETNRWVMAIQASIRYMKDRQLQRDKKIRVAPILTMNRDSTPLVTGTGNRLGSFNFHENAKSPTSPSVIDSNSKVLSPTVSKEMTVNSNLTDSGKSYVKKVIENRLEGSSSSTSSSLKGTTHPITGQQPKSSSKPPSIAKSQISVLSNEANNNNHINAETTSIDSRKIPSNFEMMDTTDNFAEGEGVSDDDEDGIELKTTTDAEDLQIEYGPYTQEINMLETNILMELNSVVELLGAKTSQGEVFSLAKGSLESVTNNLKRLKSLNSLRDTRLLTMLSKQRDANGVWAQSVKDLEKELAHKSERLDSLERERKNLKKLLNKKLTGMSMTPMTASTDVVQQNDSSSTLEYVANFIKATKENDDDSETDEFFDAEGDVDNKSAKNKNIPEVQPVDATAPPVNAPPSHLPPSVPHQVEVVRENENGKTSRKIEEKSEVQDQVSNAPPVIPTQVESNKEPNSGEAKISDTTPAYMKLYGNTVSVTKEQQKQENILFKQGSFLGYEDGIRKKLALSKDNRPAISLWSVLKSMVGKDMTRMTLPVTFNEPTSLLQRVTEDLEYTELLDQASSYKDSTLRLMYVAVFAASSYASTIKRVAKPFNPLLGETYEYSRPDKHYSFFTEQVSHHPPISATWTESPKWDFWGESYVDTKFNGRSFGVKHLGLWYLNMRPDLGSEELYTWKKPDNTVIGILVGNPQVDNHGDVNIKNHKTGDYCVLHFKARGWRSTGAYEVRGEVYNKNGDKEWLIGGHWNDSIYAKKVTGANSDGLNLEKMRTASSSSVSGPKLDGSKFLVWKAGKRPDAPFNLTPFAISLNAPQPHLLKWLAPTDTRLRPDQRAMEDGRYDDAADDKHRLEEKQRSARKQRDLTGQEYKPKWFEKKIHPVTKKPYWQFKGDYWVKRKEHDFADCPDIF